VLAKTLSVFFNCFLDHIQGSVIFDGGWVLVGLPLDYFSDNVSQYLSTPCFRQFLDNQGVLEGGNRPDLLPDHLDQFFLKPLGGIVDLGDNKGNRNFPLQLLHFGNHSSLIDPGMSKQGFFHGPSRQPMPGSVDDVVQPGGNIEVSVIVEIAGISTGIVARGLVHILIKEALIVVVESAHEGGRHRQADAYFP